MKFPRLTNMLLRHFMHYHVYKKDYRYVMDKCADIEPMTRKIESLHNLVMKQNARRVILSDTSESALGDDQEKCDVTDNIFHGKTPVLKRINVNEQCQHQQPAPREPSGCDGLLVDGFTLVTNRKSNNKKDRPRTYGDVAGHQQTRVFTNSKRYQMHNITLRAADSVRRENTWRTTGHNRNTKKQCEIFVSNLHPDTTSSDVMKYLKAEYNEYFKIEHIRTQFNDYSSFKIVAPMFLKNKLLEKSSWKANVYVRPFYTKARVY